MNFIELIFTIEPLEPGRDILMAELAEVGFDSFEYTSDGLKAYCEDIGYHHEEVIEIVDRYSDAFRISWRKGEIESINWNEEWEKNYAPIVIDNRCSIRAPFHSPRPDLEYDLVIEPKMSFGTAHHDTTALMLRWLLDMDLKNKKVLDMGCGTGVLAIFAHIRGASFIMAVDNYIWACTNTKENAARNGADFIQVLHGDVKLMDEITEDFDLILANINRNVLLDDMPAYISRMAPKGLLLLSGFFIEDEPVLSGLAEKNGLRKKAILEQNNWSSVCYEKA